GSNDVYRGVTRLGLRSKIRRDTGTQIDSIPKTIQACSTYRYCGVSERISFRRQAGRSALDNHDIETEGITKVRRTVERVREEVRTRSESQRILRDEATEPGMVVPRPIVLEP